MNTAAPDFLPQLLRLALGFSRPRERVAAQDPLDRNPATRWPQVDVLLEKLSGLYRWQEDPMMPLAALGGARIDNDNVLIADQLAWSFNAELQFRDLGSVDAPVFAIVDIEVLAGVIEIAVLAKDGSGFVGARHAQRVGRARVQLPIFDADVRSVVFCNMGPGETGGKFVIHAACLGRLEREKFAALELRRLIEAESQPPLPEVDSPAAVPATLALAFHRLLTLGRIHESARLLAAIDDFSSDRPAWLDLRLAEILVCCHAESDAIPPSPQLREALGTESSNGVARLPGTIVEELTWFRQQNGASETVPLHQELLQSLATLDLISVHLPCRIRVRWTRDGLAATPVRTGALSALFALLVERIPEPNPLVGVDVHTGPQGTILEFRSSLDNGALQYRLHSAHAAELHRALHHPSCPLPLIEHRLGAESLVRVVWETPHAPASLATIAFERRDAAAVETLYSRADGHAVRVEGDVCYKMAPTDSSKRNDLVTEASIIEALSGADFVPEVIASLRTRGSTAMSYRFMRGTTLLAWAARRPSAATINRTILRLTMAFSELNRRGVQHRDTRAENLLIDDSGNLHLLDFDQARVAFDADDFGNEWANGAVCCGFGGLLGQLGWQEHFLQKAGALGFAWELGRFSSANSPGKHSCYYDWQWGGYLLRGERPWYLRWDLLHAVFEQRVPPGRFLELGCNLGLLSTHASLAGWESKGIDHNALAVAAAVEIASALGASAQFQTGNLCESALFAQLGGGYDLVSALSVVHWLPDREPVEAFLRQQPRLLFEGHRAINDEISYLRGLGFDQVELLGYSERLRPLLFATRISP